jgi:hypothetical protein
MQHNMLVARVVVAELYLAALGEAGPSNPTTTALGEKFSFVYTLAFEHNT